MLFWMSPEEGYLQQKANGNLDQKKNELLDMNVEQREDAF
jgi:hypothetical protein